MWKPVLPTLIYQLQSVLRKSGKKIFLVVNKVDNNVRLNDAPEFYSLGFGDAYCLSAINGSGTGELLDALVKSFPDKNDEDEKQVPRFAIVGSAERRQIIVAELFGRGGAHHCYSRCRNHA
jgi:predicted GTPase